MSQKIKIQNGSITYSATDPALALAFNVTGQVNVSNELNIGNDPLIDGLITTPSGTGLAITTGTGGNLSLIQASLGALTLNNVQWPTGTILPIPGMYIGVASLNTLEYYSFIIDNNPSDVLTLAALNTQYPTATAGQMVTGPTVIYYCIAPGLWRLISAPPIA